MTARRPSFVALISIFVLGGGAVALQARVNTELHHHVDGSVQAALISFGTGWLLLTLMLIFSPSIRAGVRAMPAAVRDARLAWWAVPAGLLGGIYITSQSFEAGLLGVALFSVTVIAGQSVAALLVDRLGMGPVGKVPLTWHRVVAAIVAVLAVAIAGAGHAASSTVSLPPVLIALFAGVVIAIQQALNGRVSRGLGQPMSTTWFNFSFGLGGLLIGAFIGAIATHGTALGIPSAGPWWMYAGGPLGVLFVATAAVAVPRYGVLIFALTATAGQLFAGVLLDAIAPSEPGALTVHIVIGAVLTVVAVAVATTGQLSTSNRAR